MGNYYDRIDVLKNRALCVDVRAVQFVHDHGPVPPSSALPMSAGRPIVMTTFSRETTTRRRSSSRLRRHGPVWRPGRRGGSSHVLPLAELLSASADQWFGGLDRVQRRYATSSVG
jgi:hypothetical protein